MLSTGTKHNRIIWFLKKARRLYEEKYKQGNIADINRADKNRTRRVRGTERRITLIYVTSKEDNFLRNIRVTGDKGGERECRRLVYGKQKGLRVKEQSLGSKKKRREERRRIFQDLINISFACYFSPWVASYRGAQPWSPHHREPTLGCKRVQRPRDPGVRTPRRINTVHPTQRMYARYPHTDSRCL